MIALDTSSILAYLSGSAGPDVEALDLVLAEKRAVVPPVVISELLSDSEPSLAVRKLLGGLPPLAVLDGYWERTGFLRSRILSKGFKAPLADALIAQSCLDHDIPLLTRDEDFLKFAEFGGLRLT